jgi:hypothetical protein
VGGGTWDATTYASTTKVKIDSGTSHGYSTRTTSSTPRSSWSAHTTLDPKKVAGPTSPFSGKNVRESRDNDEHPNATPLIIAFDDTGSMGGNPAILQKELTKLFGLLLRKGYVDDPQISMAAYGDAYCDSVPLQFGEFESDNRIDDALDNLLLEGGGGGNDGETATFVWYFAAKHTETDAWDKRGKKGYLFTIGDERPLKITRDQIKRVCDDDVQDDVTPEQAAEMAKERWDCYHLLVRTGAEIHQRSEERYREYLGDDKVVIVQSVEDICETIGAIIGNAEGVDLTVIESDLKELGTSSDVAARVTSEIAKVGGNGAAGLSKVVEQDTPDDLADSEDDGLAKV